MANLSFMSPYLCTLVIQSRQFSLCIICCLYVLSLFARLVSLFALSSLFAPL